MEPPTLDKDVRICIAVMPHGLTAYCNKAALVALSKELARLAESDPREHFETHVQMRFEDEDCKFSGKRPRNVWVLRTKELAPVLAPHDDPACADFELTFMAIPEAELDDLGRHQETGLLPDDWNAEEV